MTILPKVPNKAYEQTQYAILLKKWYDAVAASLLDEMRKGDSNSDAMEEIRRTLRQLCQVGREMQNGTFRSNQIYRLSEDNMLIKRLLDEQPNLADFGKELVQFVPVEPSRETVFGRGSGQTTPIFSAAATTAPFPSR